MATSNSTILFDLADHIALVSSTILQFRADNDSTLSQPEKRQLKQIEVQLDTATANMRANGIVALAAEVEPKRQEMEAAIKKAKKVLQKINQFERILDVATSILGLGLAVIAGQPLGILSALNDVKDKVAGEEE